MDPHEEGWQVTLRADSEAVFRDPRGRVLPNAPSAGARAGASGQNSDGQNANWQNTSGQNAAQNVAAAVAAVAPDPWQAPACQGMDVGYVLQTVRGS
jgi:hypothetical protein